MNNAVGNPSSLISWREYTLRSTKWLERSPGLVVVKYWGSKGMLYVRGEETVLSESEKLSWEGLTLAAAKKYNFILGLFTDTFSARFTYLRFIFVLKYRL